MRTMKRILRLALALSLAAACICSAALAADTDGFTFALNSSGGYSITGYTGSDSTVTVPDWYLGKPVTAIGESAFQGNTSIVKVSLPSSITRIGAAGFKDCASLRTLTVYGASDAPARLPGDADDNGVVDLNDALAVLRYDAGELADIHTSNADVNGDGNADAADALILFQYGAGWNVTLQ